MAPTQMTKTRTTSSTSSTRTITTGASGTTKSYLITLHYLRSINAINSETILLNVICRFKMLVTNTAKTPIAFSTDERIKKKSQNSISATIAHPLETITITYTISTPQ